jgi:hypothetical protein
MAVEEFASEVVSVPLAGVVLGTAAFFAWWFVVCGGVSGS